jgi:hypothetical protein
LEGGGGHAHENRLELVVAEAVDDQCVELFKEDG